MCLAVPAKVIEVHASEEMALVELDGICKEVSTSLIEDAAVGDYVLVHVGFALSKLSEEEAQATLTMFAELAAQNVEDAS